MTTTSAIEITVSPAAVAANLSCLLYLARHHGEGDAELDEASRVFLQSLNGQALVIESGMAGLSLGGRRVPSSSPGAAQVNEHLLAHHIEKISLVANAGTGDAVALARVLAAFPGTFGDWDQMVRALGSASERISLTESRSSVPIIHFYDSAEQSMSPRDEEDMLSVLHGSNVVEEAGLIPPPLPVPPPQSPQPPKATVSAAKDSERLSALLVRGRSAVEAGDWQRLLDVLGDMLRAETEASSEAAGRVYRLELRRLLSRNEIGQLARMAALGGRRDDAIVVLRRLGADATEVLMDLLVESEAMGERRGYYSALTRMDDGTDIIIHHLGHPLWYVVRNSAELCGEMGLQRAVPDLAARIDHPDERVRKSIATALARIGTPEAMEPLARMLKDPSPAIRLNVISSLDGERARPLAMPLAAMLQQEENPDVAREVLRALGRIGTPDALMALRGIATGNVKGLGRKARVQAVEALALAGPGAGPILQSLSKDPDRDVSGAARKALSSPTS